MTVIALRLVLNATSVFRRGDVNSTTGPRLKVDLTTNMCDFDQTFNQLRSGPVTRLKLQSWLNDVVDSGLDPKRVRRELLRHYENPDSGLVGLHELEKWCILFFQCGQSRDLFHHSSVSAKAKLSVEQ